jgi:hypothetical protein
LRFSGKVRLFQRRLEFFASDLACPFSIEAEIESARPVVDALEEVNGELEMG